MSNISQSIQKNKYGILIMVFSSVCTAFGQYLWKLSVKDSSLWYLLLGFALYGLGALLMITAFKFGSLSVLHPVLSLGYIFALLIGFFFLNEVIKPGQIAGLLFILFGVAMIGVGDE